MGPSAIGMDQRRRRAVLRVMEKMLDDESLDQGTFVGMHDAFSVKLWKVTRCMSGQEFLMAAEERVLGDGIDTRSRHACAYPGCTVVWGETTDPGDAPRVASGLCCSAACAEHMSAHVTRLGSDKDASARFSGLYQLAKRERDERTRLAKGNGGTPTQTSGTQTAPGTNEMNTNMSKELGKSTRKANDANEMKKSSPKLAAGTSKVPIMHAVVKERLPGAASAGSQKQKDVVFDAEAVEGYRPKNQDDRSDSRTKESRRVRFAPEELLEQKREFLSHEPPAAVEHVTESTTAADQVVDGDEARQLSHASPHFVFDIEDPRGPVDDDMKSIGDMIGTLNVVVPGEEGEENGNVDDETIPASNAAGDGQSVDAILARTLRDGAKHFPHLSIPDEVVQQMNALDLELAEENDGIDGIDGHPDDDSELDGYENIDSDFFSTDEDEDVPISCQKTFFTQIYTFFDYWITDMTLQMIGGDDTTSHPPTQPVPQVPEVVTAIQRFITIGCATLATRLCVDTNADADVNRQVIADSIARLVGTFRLDAALPAFDSKQWLVVCLAMLKALSVHCHPRLQTLTETPNGAARVGEILGDACFTSEELLAVVSLLLGEV